MWKGNVNRLIPFIALIPLVALALTPPFSFQLDCTINSMFWVWMVFASGFLTMLYFYQDVSKWLKLFILWCFVSCFLSNAPYISFTMFWTVIACAYYYALCRKIEDWTPVYKAIQAIFLFIVILIIMQQLGKDTLLNFGQKNDITGTIGNKMIFSSFVCVLAPLLIVTPLNWLPLVALSIVSSSSGAILSIGTGLAIWSWAKLTKKLRIIFIILALLVPIIFAYKTGDMSTFFNAGRGPVWKKTIELVAKRPLGYGIATYRVLFPVLCGEEISKQQPGRAWLQAHNSWLQLPFEVGIVGSFLLLGWIISIVRKIKDPIKWAGIAILSVNMLTAFPDRMCQSVLIIVMFLAYCERKENEQV